MRRLSSVACFAGVATFLLGTATLAVRAAEPADATSIMQTFSHEFGRLERALDARDAAGVNESTSALRAAAKELARVDVARDKVGIRALEDQVDALQEYLGEVRQLASEANFDHAALALEDVRSTCVACHVRFRPDNEERGMFPATGNTVSGRIELRDVDGKPMDDHSWVLAFLETTEKLPAPPPPRRSPVLDQRDRSFEPRVLPVVKGTTVEFPNNDTIFHNVFSLSKTAPFDLGIYESGSSKSVEMKRSGLVKVYCNIHPDMQASIVVLPNAHFDLTDEAGVFTITGVPDGKYRLRAWNDRGGSAATEIEVSGNRWLNTELLVKETQRVLPHNNKFGKPYSKKYR